MTCTLGIRREDKNRWERRVPLVPHHLQQLKEQYGINTIIQPSRIRVFSDKEFQRVGASVQDSLRPSSVIFAVKEIPSEVFEPEKTYVFFSHTIKGQSRNMPMLKKMIQMGCTLIDYERIVDRNGKRLVFFGRYAGLAGMVDTLWAFGQRAKWEGIASPFQNIRQTIHYKSLEDITKHLMSVGKEIKTKGLPQSLTPFIIGFGGYGNVSMGAQEILENFPVQEISPENLTSTVQQPTNKALYKVVFREEHMVEPRKPDARFDLQDYYAHPENYRSVFEKYIPFLSIFMNCIYWSARYPRLITKNYLKKSFEMNRHLGPRVIGDISADVNGAVEFTEKTTSPDSPVFIYNPLTGTIQDGCKSEGVVVMAIDNLPCELPSESSESFSETLLRFVPDIMKADFTTAAFEDLALPLEIKNAVILYRGKLTPAYQYINKFL
ncbi:MAG TPA: bifunctional lysine ketoglutarate reductase /saccharopine dehydrogenase family protein [Candidatus Thermoplasmatota archaeon]|nr:bifunctional lysine ketoglutarate reductase /saccharopine dehydrogenase family protein [Candidatus Thermoplasmatota archaeon]